MCASCLDHDLGNILYICVGHIRLEQVAHAVDEYGTRAGPFKRLSEFCGNEPEVKASFVGMARHSAKALGKRLGVAVFAAGADLGAAAQRIPRGVGPFDL